MYYVSKNMECKGGHCGMIYDILLGSAYLTGILFAILLIVRYKDRCRIHRAFRNSCNSDSTLKGASEEQQGFLQHGLRTSTKNEVRLTDSYVQVNGDTAVYSTKAETQFLFPVNNNEKDWVWVK